MVPWSRSLMLVTLFRMLIPGPKKQSPVMRTPRTFQSFSMIGVLMGHRRRKCHKLNGEQPQKSPHARRMDLETGQDVPCCKLSVPHDFPAQKLLLEGMRRMALHCLAAWPNESASRYLIVHRYNRCPGPAVFYSVLLCCTYRESTSSDCAPRRKQN